MQQSAMNNVKTHVNVLSTIKSKFYEMYIIRLGFGMEWEGFW